MEDIFGRLYGMTAFSNIIEDPSFLVMYAIAFILLYLGIKKHYEPLLLVPIAFGVLIANFPGGEMGVIQADENGMVMVNGVLKSIWEMPLHEIAHELGLMNFIYYMLIKTVFRPTSQDSVQFLPIPSRYVFHVRYILQTTLDLQGRDTGIQQLLQPAVFSIQTVAFVHEILYQ